MPRKKRIRDQSNQRRRARLASLFDDKSAAGLFQSWLADQRQRAAAVEAREREAAGLAEAARKANSVTADAHKNLAELEVAGGATSLKEKLDPLALLSELLSSESPLPAKAAEGAALSAAERRGDGLQNQTPFSSPKQNEMARLQARAKAETQRADFVTGLLEEMLSASAARIVKHQARLEALQAQINALQGR